MSPERSYFVLTAYIPHIESDILVSDTLYIESHSRYGAHLIRELQPIQNCCLAGRVQTEHDFVQNNANLGDNTGKTGTNGISNNYGELSLIL